MTETSFNYAAPAFTRHATRPGFWPYARTLAIDPVRFAIRLDRSVVQQGREPVATTVTTSTPASSRRPARRISVGPACAAKKTGLGIPGGH